jgi:hypothetical protein
MGFLDAIIDSWREACDAVENPKIFRGTVLRVELTRLGIVGFDHFGIYAGNKEVFHFSEGKIKKESLSKFIEGAGIFNAREVDVMRFSSEYTKHISLEQSYRRAQSCLGMTGYDVIDSNCEHFALWCRTGRAISGQAFGSESDRFNIINNTTAAALNLPRMIGILFNKLGMEKSRTIFIDNLKS